MKPIAQWLWTRQEALMALFLFGSDLTFGYSNGIPHEIDPAIHVTNTAIVTIPYALELNPVTGPGQWNSGSSPRR